MLRARGRTACRCRPAPPRSRVTHPRAAAPQVMGGPRADVKWRVLVVNTYLQAGKSVAVAAARLRASGCVPPGVRNLAHYIQYWAAAFEERGTVHDAYHSGGDPRLPKEVVLRCSARFKQGIPGADGQRRRGFYSWHEAWEGCAWFAEQVAPYGCTADTLWRRMRAEDPDMTLYHPDLKWRLTPRDCARRRTCAAELLAKVQGRPGELDTWVFVDQCSVLCDPKRLPAEWGSRYGGGAARRRSARGGRRRARRSAARARAHMQRTRAAATLARAPMRPHRARAQPGGPPRGGVGRAALGAHAPAQALPGGQRAVWAGERGVHERHNRRALRVHGAHSLGKQGGGRRGAARVEKVGARARAQVAHGEKCKPHVRQHQTVAHRHPHIVARVPKLNILEMQAQQAAPLAARLGVKAAINLLLRLQRH